MHYNNIHTGRFCARPNRFIAQVELNGQMVVCHVKNTGRCRELLVPGATVYLEESQNPTRKTRFDLVAVEKEGRLINMDSQAPNRIFQEWATSGAWGKQLVTLRPETTYGNSRFDFYWEDSISKGFVEVKGVTLEENGVVRFPDAPTQRGIKHLEELIKARADGYETAVCFIIQMEGVSQLEPNDRTQPAFGQTLRRAADAGVQLMALDCYVDPAGIQAKNFVPICLLENDG